MVCEFRQKHINALGVAPALLGKENWKEKSQFHPTKEMDTLISERLLEGGSD